MSPVSPSAGPAAGRASVPSQRGPEQPGPVYRGGRPRRRPRWGRILLVAGIGLLVLTLGLGAAGWAYYHNLSNDVNRTDPFAAITGDRPAKTVDGSLNILILGSDSRDPDNKAQAGEWRTDTLILAHIPASHDKAYLVSLPRDLYVHIPRSPTNKKLGNTNAKINAAFAWGGLPLAVQTVEGYTKLRVDHVMLIDFGGFKQIVNALGGVDLPIDRDITSIHPPFRKFTKGVMHLDGDASLDWVRQRKQFPEGDFARVQHQQQFMKAVLDKAASGDTLTNPLKLNSFLKSAAKAVTVDKDLSIIDMGLQFRGIRSKDLVFLVSPHLGSKRVNGEDVVMPDATKAAAMYEAFGRDKAAEWAAQNGSPAPSTK